MSIYDFLYIVAFLLMMAIFLTKIYNMFMVGKWYDLKIAFILYIVYVLALGVTFFITLINPTRLIYLVLFRLGSWLLAFNTLFLVIELVLNWGLFDRSIKAYNPRD